MNEAARVDPVPDTPTFADVEAAARRIAPHVRRTPVATSRGIDRRLGVEIAFKCENLQRAGAFKFRGACNAVLSRPESEVASGVCTHSSGNHGAAVALAARLRSIPATVVMPAGAPRAKREAVESFGAEVIECEPTLAARESTLRAVMNERGGRLVHPYDDFHVIAGQGTAALELLDDPVALPWCKPPSGPPDALLVPVGGGGLLGGSAVVGAARGCRVFGAEPAGADDAARSLRAGRIVPMDAPRTIADGLRTSLGARNFAIIHRTVEDILTVSEDAIRAAMRLLFERTKLVVEPSGAVPVAALLEHGPPRGCTRIGIVLSGGNVDLDSFRFPEA